MIKDMTVAITGIYLIIKEGYLDTNEINSFKANTF